MLDNSCCCSQFFLRLLSLPDVGRSSTNNFICWEYTFKYTFRIIKCPICHLMQRNSYTSGETRSSKQTRCFHDCATKTVSRFLVNYGFKMSGHGHINNICQISKTNTCGKESHSGSFIVCMYQIKVFLSSTCYMEFIYYLPVIIAQ